MTEGAQISLFCIHAGVRLDSEIKIRHRLEIILGAEIHHHHQQQQQQQQQQQTTAAPFLPEALLTLEDWLLLRYFRDNMLGPLAVSSPSEQTERAYHLLLAGVPIPFQERMTRELWKLLLRLGVFRWPRHVCNLDFADFRRFQERAEEEAVEAMACGTLLGFATGGGVGGGLGVGLCVKRPEKQEFSDTEEI